VINVRWLKKGTFPVKNILFPMNFIVPIDGDRLTEVRSAVGLDAETPGEKALGEIRKAVAATSEFDPKSEAEGRKRTLAAICRRQGQPEFRRKLIEAYGGRCAISGFNVLQTLEAAHIMPYNGPKTNHPANGILMRADLHVLFDLGLIAVDPSTLAVVLASALRTSPYADFEGKRLRLPSEPALRPSSEALKKHKVDSGL